MALVRAAGYFYVDRYNLVLAKDSIFNGAGYTDVHVRLPAIELLAVVALAVFVLMVFNVYQRRLALPAIGAGLWVLVALTAGVIVPAARPGPPGHACPEHARAPLHPAQHHRDAGGDEPVESRTSAPSPGSRT